MQLYDITIATNTTRQLDAPGSYFYYYAGSAGGADSTITLRGVSSGLRLILKPGQAFRLPSGDVETSWILTNYANVSTIIGTVLVGDGDITDNRVTGSVEVIDGGKYRTIANQVFGQRVSFAALAGNWNTSQIWNPSNSGKRIIVKSYSCIGGAAIVGWNTAQIGSVNGFIGNKLSNGTASTCETRASQLPTANVVGLTINNAIPSGIQIVEPEPIIITPGYGFIMVTDSSAVSTVHTTHFVEEVI